MVTRISVGNSRIFIFILKLGALVMVMSYHGTFLLLHRPAELATMALDAAFMVLVSIRGLYAMVQSKSGPSTVPSSIAPAIKDLKRDLATLVKALRLLGTNWPACLLAYHVIRNLASIFGGVEVDEQGMLEQLSRKQQGGNVVSDFDQVTIMMQNGLRYEYFIGEHPAKFLGAKPTLSPPETTDLCRSAAAIDPLAWNEHFPSEVAAPAQLVNFSVARPYEWVPASGSAPPPFLLGSPVRQLPPTYLLLAGAGTFGVTRPLRFYAVPAPYTNSIYPPVVPSLLDTSRQEDEQKPSVIFELFCHRLYTMPSHLVIVDVEQKPGEPDTVVVLGRRETSCSLPPCSACHVFKYVLVACLERGRQRFNPLTAAFLNDFEQVDHLPGEKKMTNTSVAVARSPMFKIESRKGAGGVFAVSRVSPALLGGRVCCFAFVSVFCTATSAEIAPPRRSPGPPTGSHRIDNMKAHHTTHARRIGQPFPGSKLTRAGSGIPTVVEPHIRSLAPPAPQALLLRRQVGQQRAPYVAYDPPLGQGEVLPPYPAYAGHAAGHE
ncbi:hypothetical protein M427DRAFT_44476 [Gonapodya prolifera JEL478]|uniref:Uncharacterized protein n=1 Tax=Gonapodya prolifera (strain JEL478) TaxID=1344416 RepID=A0A139AFC4_GONPJ|nr:hypothetical protein M427DRAFT_44476 [Gonapodya prolifera JEL478]|eukprot:KXS15389.1 hypothetical protein M427DRAFT_44476 [Gonapodya prolifera JEL478]